MADSRRTRLGLIIAVTTLATIAIAALLVNIFERKQEARQTFFRVVEITDDTEDPAIWGKNFPLQYDAYQAHRGSNANSVRRIGSNAPVADAGGSSQRGRAEQTRRRSATRRDVVGVRILNGLPGGARPLVHAR